MIAPIKWHIGLAIKDANDPFIVAFREGRIQPGETKTTILGGDIYVAFPPFEDELPDGLWRDNGTLMFECRSCENATEWPAEPEDFELGHYANVCGGSPWCLP